MKNYSTSIAAQKLVSKHVMLGVSRHDLKGQKIDVITSVGTARNHQSALKICADWLLEAKGKHLQNIDEIEAAEYLTLRALTVGQSAVDLDRQALNFHLFFESPVPFIPSQIERKLTNRAYTSAQIDLLALEASARLELSIRVAEAAGLRAMELLTISLPEYLGESQRAGWKLDRFLGRENEVIFIVHGKGGLCREVRLPAHLAKQLLACLRPAPITITDRKANHLSYFYLIGGVNFSSQFSQLSMKVLGASNGAHGLRHTFAKKRLRDLMCLGLTYENALHVLSNELGHFSTANTFAYLRD